MKGLLRVALFLAVLASLGAAGWYAADRYQESATEQIPLAPSRSGEFLAIVRCRGELKANRSVQVYVPLMPNLRIAWMAPAGELVREGEPVIRFDSSSGQQDLIQKQAALAQAQAGLDQAISQGRITSEHDQADVKDGGFQVELARIKTVNNEFVPRLEAERNSIDLATAEQKLKVQEATVDQHLASDASKLASLTRQRDQAKAELEIAQTRLTRMEVPAPLTGFWIVNSNYQGTTSQPFKIGDAVTSGMSVAVIPDMASLMLDVKVEEIDRGRIQAGADVRVKVDAVPELVIPAKLTQISPLAELSLEGVIARSFRAYAALPNPDPRLRPGMNGGMDIVIERIPDAISVPAKAIFTRAGKPIVYLSTGAGAVRAVDVQVLARNPDEVAVSGIPKGAMVALVEPKTQGKNP
jgi:RND family efflux transporter MFP subunit